MLDYTIVSGDCLSSIARRFGFADYRIIYDHPRNAAFRAKRPNPNVVFPGDVVFVPDPEARVESRPTGGRHVFRTRALPTRLRLVLICARDRPRAGVEYVLSFGDVVVKGRTGEDGLIEHVIPADARVARLTFPATGVTRQLQLGEMEPPDTVSGVQERLRNLGYDSGPVDGVEGPRTRGALRAFQRDNLSRPDPDGKCDAETKDALVRRHGC